MALKIIGGVNGRPILGYPGITWIAMESPCPYAQWAFTETYTSHAALTHSSGSITLTCTEVIPGVRVFIGSFDLQMIYTGANTITFSGSKSGFTGNFSISGYPVVDGIDLASFSTLSNSVSSATLATPYYRYRLRIAMIGYPDNDSFLNGTVNLTVSLS